jgi:hypothetical protein
MTISQDDVLRLARARSISQIDSPEWLSVVLLQDIAETVALLAAEVTMLRRAVDRAVERGTDPPEAREFRRRPR